MNRRNFLRGAAATLGALYFGIAAYGREVRKRKRCCYDDGEMTMEGLGLAALRHGRAGTIIMSGDIVVARPASEFTRELTVWPAWLSPTALRAEDLAVACHYAEAGQMVRLTKYELNGSLSEALLLAQPGEVVCVWPDGTVRWA